MTWKPVAIKYEAHSSDVIKKMKWRNNIFNFLLLLLGKGTDKDFK